MSIITAQNIITRVQSILQDDTGIRWPSTELLLWISDAQREICLLKPDASAINEIVKLTANTTKQTMARVEIDGSGTNLYGSYVIYTLLILTMLMELAQVDLFV